MASACRAHCLQPLPASRSLRAPATFSSAALPAPRFLRQARTRPRIAPRAGASPQPPAPAKTAKESVERGLELFEAGDASGALALFQGALTLSPSADEARAALYNSACAHSRLRAWGPAAAAVVAAVNDYDLKLSVALQDPDLAPLRERREWLAALNEVRGGLTDEQASRLRAEAKAPFRLPRLFLFGALAAGAGLGLLIITARLVAALRGGEGAPDLQETAQNLGINAGVLAVLALLLWRDLSADRRDRELAAREEGLARLQVALGPDRIVPLAAFRGAVRPLLLAGSRGQVARALAAAEPLRPQLRARGVSLVPLVLEGDDPDERLRRLKAEFSGGAAGEEGAAAPSGRGFAKSNKDAAAAAAAPAGDGPVPEQSRKWVLEPHDTREWEEWLLETLKAAGLARGPAYVQVQLDGSVRSSGVGQPNWQALISDLPELSSLQTRLTDGRGMPNQ